MLIDECKSVKRAFSRALKLMGNRFELTAVSTDEMLANLSIDAAVSEIQRIEKLLTTYSEESETCLINRFAGKEAVSVSAEIFNLIKRSLKISRITQGAFDISYGSVDRNLWNFNAGMSSLPDKKTAAAMVHLIDYRNILLDEEKHAVFLKKPGMRIGFGGIGKGYAAERAKQIMSERGIESGIVNASGDLAVWGEQPNGEAWTIGIVDPNHVGKAFSFLKITNMAIATSGNYEKFIMVGGKKYSHTIDPKTGLPVTGIKSVTIISPNAEIADAMATPVMIMGIKAALDMINQIDDIEAIMIDDQNKIYASKNIRFS